LFVRLGRENVTLDATATIGQGPLSAMPMTRDGEINSVVEILKGRTLVEQLVDFLTPEAILEDQTSIVDPVLALITPADDDEGSPRDMAVLKLSKRLTINAIRKSNLVSVTCDAHDPELARRAVDKYVELFLEQYRGLYRNPQAISFFNEQAALLGDRVQETETKLLQVKNKAGLGSVDDQRRILIGQIGSLEDEIRKTQTEVKASEAHIKAYRQKLQILPKTVVTAQISGYPNAAADLIRQRLYELQLKENELSSRMTDEHIMVKQARAEVAAAQAIHEKEEASRTQVTDSISRAYDEVNLSLVMEETKLDAHRARQAALEPQLASAQKRLADINAAEIDVARLQRQLDLQRTSHSKYTDSLEQTRIDRALEQERISNINIAQPASREVKAVKPIRLLYFGLSFCLATFAAIGLPLLCEPFGHASHGPHDIHPRLDAMPLPAPVPSFREMATLHSNGNGNGSNGNGEGH